jgi:hypothetical protein
MPEASSRTMEGGPNISQHTNASSCRCQILLILADVRTCVTSTTGTGILSPLCACMVPKASAREVSGLSQDHSGSSSGVFEGSRTCTVYRSISPSGCGCRSCPGSMIPRGRLSGSESSRKGDGVEYCIRVGYHTIRVSLFDIKVKVNDACKLGCWG